MHAHVHAAVCSRSGGGSSGDAPADSVLLAGFFVVRSHLHHCRQELVVEVAARGEDLRIAAPSI